MTAALETQELGRRYGSQWALQGCTLEIPRGTVTALVGPNGAGKTTLLRLAVGLTRPSAGSVRVFGLDPRDEAAEALPRVGFLAQEHPLYGGFTVEEMLRVGRKLIRAGTTRPPGTASPSSICLSARRYGAFQVASARRSR
jgi:ABC-2 type transport system ATP-binding protein